MIWTTKAINSAVITITTGTNDTLTLNVDGVDQSITLPSGDYSTNYIKHVSDLVDAMNVQFNANAIPVVAKLGGIFGDTDVLRKNVVVFEHTSGGTISTTITGNMSTLLV